LAARRVSAKPFVMSTLTEQEFEHVADEALHALDSALTDLDGLEVSLEMGILTLEHADGTKYVVNSHRAARQIWMAAERNAWHFDYRPEGGRWVASKSGDELWSTLSAVISRKLGRRVELAPTGSAP
jgi:CyaY protein